MIFPEARGSHKTATDVLGEEPAGPEQMEGMETFPGQEVKPEVAVVLGVFFELTA